MTACAHCRPGSPCELGQPASGISQSVVVDEAPRMASLIITEQLMATPTGAVDQGVCLALCPKARVGVAMGNSVVPLAREEFEVVWPVVALVAVPVMHDLPTAQSPAEHLLHNKAVLIGIVAGESRQGLRSTNEDVTPAGDATATLPMGVGLTDVALVVAGVASLGGGFLGATAFGASVHLHTMSVAHQSG